MLRKFFFSAGAMDAPGSEDEMPSDADYSRIAKLLEIEKHYDDLKARNSDDIEEREQRIKQLEEELRQHRDVAAQWEERMRTLDEEKERVNRTVDSLRGEYEAKIERLQARIRELSSDSAPAAPSRGGGLFRRG